MGDGPLTRHRARPRLYPSEMWAASGPSVLRAEIDRFGCIAGMRRFGPHKAGRRLGGGTAPNS